MSDERTPALTPEEWKVVERALNDYADGLHDAEADLEGLRIQQVAWSIRDGQPFGFTWEDVDMLRERVRNCREAEERGRDLMDPERIREAKIVGDACESLADRIAALLPPRPDDD